MSTQSEGRATGSSARPTPTPSARSTSAASGPGSAASGGSSPSGVVAGIVVGGLYSLSGGSPYEATARIAPGQAFNPAGSPVFTYLTNPTADQPDRDVGGDDPGGGGEGRHAARPAARAASRPRR